MLTNILYHIRKGKKLDVADLIDEDIYASIYATMKKQWGNGIKESINHNIKQAIGPQIDEILSKSVV